jgi:hypothetical protein
MQKVTITIDTSGSPKIEVEGVAGPECNTATEALEKALGEVRSDKLTADFHRRERARVKH